MTSPNHTDTIRSGDLVETLLCVDRGGVLHSRRPKQTHPVCAKAADHIEALQAENERLRDDSWFDQFEEQEQLRDNAEQRLSVVEAENERLRRVLARWQYSGCPHCSGDCGSANPPVTSCIMDETRAALGEKQ